MTDAASSTRSHVEVASLFKNVVVVVLTFTALVVFELLPALFCLWWPFLKTEAFRICTLLRNSFRY
jgi:hypothetical protein